MVEISSTAINPVTIKSGKNRLSFNTPDDLAVTSPQISGEIKISDSEMVFAGFGIVAPEYNRDDYSGLDVKGKTVVVMINDPGLYSGDTSYFKGRI